MTKILTTTDFADDADYFTTTNYTNYTNFTPARR